MTNSDDRALCLLADAAGRVLAHNYAAKTAAADRLSDMEKEAIQLSSLLPRLGGAAKGGFTGMMSGAKRVGQAASSAAGGGGYTPSLYSRLQGGARQAVKNVRGEIGERAGSLAKPIPRGQAPSAPAPTQTPGAAQAAPAAAGGSAAPVGGEVGGQIQQEAARRGVSVGDYLRGMAVMGVGGAAGYGALQARPPQHPTYR